MSLNRWRRGNCRLAVANLVQLVNNLLYNCVIVKETRLGFGEQTCLHTRTLSQLEASPVSTVPISVRKV